MFNVFPGYNVRFHILHVYLHLDFLYHILIRIISFNGIGISRYGHFSGTKLISWIVPSWFIIKRTMLIAAGLYSLNNCWLLIIVSLLDLSESYLSGYYCKDNQIMMELYTLSLVWYWCKHVKMSLKQRSKHRHLNYNINLLP